MTSAAPGSSVRSSRRTSLFLPALSTSRAVLSAPASSSCQAMPMSKPSRASATAVALPMPESDPVTMAAGIGASLQGEHGRVGAAGTGAKPHVPDLTLSRPDNRELAPLLGAYLRAETYALHDDPCSACGLRAGSGEPDRRAHRLQRRARAPGRDRARRRRPDRGCGSL